MKDLINTLLGYLNTPKVTTIILGVTGILTLLGQNITATVILGILAFLTFKEYKI